MNKLKVNRNWENVTSLGPLRGSLETRGNLKLVKIKFCLQLEGTTLL